MQISLCGISMLTLRISILLEYKYVYTYIYILLLWQLSNTTNICYRNFIEFPIRCILLIAVSSESFNRKNINRIQTI